MHRHCRLAGLVQPMVSDSNGPMSARSFVAYPNLDVWNSRKRRFPKKAIEEERERSIRVKADIQRSICADEVSRSTSFDRRCTDGIFI